MTTSIPARTCSGRARIQATAGALRRPSTRPSRPCPPAVSMNTVCQQSVSATQAPLAGSLWKRRAPRRWSSIPRTRTSGIGPSTARNVRTSSGSTTTGSTASVVSGPPVSGPPVSVASSVSSSSPASASVTTAGSAATIPARPARRVKPPCAVCQATPAQPAAVSTATSPSPTRWPTRSRAPSETRPPRAASATSSRNRPCPQPASQAITRLCQVTRIGANARWRTVCPTRVHTRDATAWHRGWHTTVPGAATTCTETDPSASRSTSSTSKPSSPSSPATAHPVPCKTHPFFGDHGPSTSRDLSRGRVRSFPGRHAGHTPSQHRRYPASSFKHGRRPTTKSPFSPSSPSSPRLIH